MSNGTEAKQIGRIRILGSPGSAAAVRRIAVVGDFLPAGLPGADDESAAQAAAARMAPLFEDVDWLLLNLECPISVDGLAAAPKPGSGDPMSAPADVLAHLPALGPAPVAGLANNHLYDFGPEGVARTRAALEERGIPSLGAGRTTGDEPEVVVLDGPDGIRVGIWCSANATLHPATARSEGVEPLKLERGRAALARMHELGATFRVALVHAGLEKTNRPDPSDKRSLDDLAEAGFDLVAACHSHRTSGFSEVATSDGRTALALYGLGSLSSSVMYSDLEREGVAVVVGLDGTGRPVEAELRAIHLREDGWGEPPAPGPAEAITGRVVEVTREIQDGSYTAAFYADMSEGLLGKQLRDARRAFRNDGLRGVARKLRRARVKHLRRLAHKLLPRRG